MKPKILVISHEMRLLPERPPTHQALRTHTLVGGLRWHGHEVILSVPRPQLDALPTAPPALADAAHEPGQLEPLIERIKPDVVLLDSPMPLAEQLPTDVGLIVDLALDDELEGADAVLGQVDLFLARDAAHAARIAERVGDRVRAVPFSAPTDDPPARQRQDEPTIVAWWCGRVGPPRGALQPLIGVLEAQGVGRLELIGPEVKFLPDAPRVVHHGELTWQSLCSTLARGWVGLQLDAPSATGRPALHTLIDMWCGLPPIVGREHPLAEKIGLSGAGWIVDADDPDAVAQLVQTLIGPPERVDHSSRLTRSVAADHGWDRATEPLVTFCSELTPVADRPAARRIAALTSQSTAHMAAELGTQLAELSAQQADTMRRLGELATSMTDTRQKMEETLSSPTPTPEQEKAIAQLTDALALTKSELRDRLTHVAQHEARAEAAEEERLAMAASLADRNAEVGVARERLEEQSQRIDRQASRLDQQTAQLEQLTVRLDEREKALEHTRSETVAQSKDLHEAMAERDRQAEQIGLLQSENTRLGELAAESERLRVHGEHMEERAGRLTGDLERASHRLAHLEEELSRIRETTAYRLSRRVAPIFSPVGALSVLVVVLLVLLVLPPEALDPIKQARVDYPWTFRGLVAVLVLGALAGLYRLRHRLPSWLTFKWRWLTPTRARWLGSIKLAFLFIVSMVLMVYVKLWELVRRRRVTS